MTGCVHGLTAEFVHLALIGNFSVSKMMGASSSPIEMAFWTEKH